MRSLLCIARRALGLAPLIVLGCAADFDTSRQVPPRGTLGRELFTVVCERVGAQSLREDVTGASFDAMCHRDAVTGKYADKVDVSQLPDLQDPAYTKDGTPVPLAQQQAYRAYAIARVEALARRREDIIGALDFAMPDKRIPVLPAEGKPCDPSSASGAIDVGFHEELAATLGRMIDLYTDADETLPSVTRGAGRMLQDVSGDPDVQGALARLDARQGYRPMPIILGAVRPLLAYPRLVELARAVVTPMLAQPGQPETPQAKAFDDLLKVGYQELRTPSTDPLPAPLSLTDDPSILRSALSRPRSFTEGASAVLGAEKPVFSIGSPEYIVRRDVRGYAKVPLKNGVVPPPFLDVTGPNSVPDGLPDIDPLGQFATVDGLGATSPLFTRDGRDGNRDSAGRAIAGNGDSTPLYDYVDTRSTALAALARDIKPFFAHGSAGSVSLETAMNFVGALPVLAGSRDATAATTKVYPPDPNAVADWKTAHGGGGTPPAGTGATPISLPYRAFHTDDSAVVDLAYALGQIAATPEVDDLLQLAQQLFTDHPEQLASLMGMALEIRKIAAAHPEATIPDASTFWDDLFVQLAPVAHEPGLFEDFLRAFMDPKTLPLESALATFLTMKDDVSYDTMNLNGPSKDIDTGATPPNFLVPVDRSQPDVGKNRSELQKFLSLLHDTNGLSICTKDNAIVHVFGNVQGIQVKFDYPTDPFYVPIVCGLVGKPVPAKLNRCDVFGYQNVMSLLLDVLLGKAQLTVRDPCLNALMSSSFATLAGGADHFLEVMSGVQGFSLHPNLRGFARLLYFQTPYPGLPTDANASGNALTLNFLKDTVDPIESMVCDPAPFTAADGTVYPLRKCSSVDDTLRARDPDALFPVDEVGFVPSLQPLAAAFDKHSKPLLFANLWDVLHLHYGSAQQPKSVCDPSLPRSNARWCAQSGLVTWEPLYADVLKNGFFGRLQTFLSTAATMKVHHCTGWDANHMCTGTVDYDGVHVVSEAMAMMLDPARTPGLVDRTGSSFANRNDGQKTDPLSAMSLVVDGFKQIDRAFASYASANPGDADRQKHFHEARSNFVDTFLAVNGAGPTATFANPTLVNVVPDAIRVLREQIAAHCQIGTPCTWAQNDLAQNVASTIGGPTFAAAADLVDALRQDDAARGEIETLVTYLLDAASGNEAQAGVLSAILDQLQLWQDDVNLQPFEKVMARGVRPPIVDDSGNVVQRSVADAAMRSLAKIFELEPGTAASGGGQAQCTTERDPNRAIGALLTGLVTPMAPDQPTPVEVLMSAIADVNRADPSKGTKLAGGDYGNIASEMGNFCLDETRGLEQFYSVIRQVTGH